jgi:hypothetical protein
MFTTEAHAAIVARLELGRTLAEASRAVGVRPATARGWLFRGRMAKAGAYREFADHVDGIRGCPRASTVPLEQLVRAGSIRAARALWKIRAGLS